jgi:hypothetical protein
MNATEQIPAPRGKFSRVRTVSIGNTKFLCRSGSPLLSPETRIEIEGVAVVQGQL